MGGIGPGELSFFAAFAGGVLSILSPCSSLLLPAFFALAFRSRAQLTAQAALFYGGLATVFVPLGLGVSAIAGLFVEHREIVIAVTGALLVGFGLFTLGGGGFEIAPALARRLNRTEGRFAAYATGLAYGFGGFCTGPILGAVLTLAAASDQALLGGALLATYALGMTLPVLLLALAWDALRLGERRWVAAAVRVGPAQVPVARLASGSLFIVMGLVFVAFRGSSALGGLYAAAGLSNLFQSAQVELQRGDAAWQWAVAAALLALAFVVARALARRPS